MLKFWPEALLWQICGMLTAIVAFVLIELPQRHLHGSVLVSAAAMGVYWAAVAAILALPVTFAAILIWTLLAQRWPTLEANRAKVVLSVGGYALAIALVLAVIDNWELFLRPEPGPHYPGSHPSVARSVLEAVIMIYPALLVGLVLPRLVIPALRPGVFAQGAPARAVA